MSLIKCPECNKKISNKASMCPTCGFPLDKLPILDKLNLEANNIHEEEDLICPNFPQDLSVRGMLVNWAWSETTAFSGFFDSKENVIKELKTGKIHVHLCRNGIHIIGNWSQIITIHNLQIISLKQITYEELVRADKSIIGRAIVGHLIAGPLGAIIGGMSGIGTKEKLKNKSYLIINFWDVKTRKPQSMLISGDDILIRSFIKRHKKETGQNY